DQIDLRIGRQHARGVLVFFGGVTDGVRALDVCSALLDQRDYVLEVVSVERGLIKNLHLWITIPIDRFRTFDRGNDVIALRIEIVRVADYLAMLRIADED